MRDEIDPDGERAQRRLSPAVWMVVAWIIVGLLVVFPFPWAWL